MAKGKNVKKEPQNKNRQGNNSEAQDKQNSQYNAMQSDKRGGNDSGGKNNFR